MAILRADMAHDTHAAAHDPSDGPHEHPVLPPVQDEAQDTPTWVPLVGLGLLAVFAVFGVLRAAWAREAAPVDEVSVEVAPPAAVPAE